MSVRRHQSGPSSAVETRTQHRHDEPSSAASQRNAESPQKGVRENKQASDIIVDAETRRHEKQVVKFGLDIQLAGVSIVLFRCLWGKALNKSQQYELNIILLWMQVPPSAPKLTNYILQLRKTHEGSWSLFQQVRGRNKPWTGHWPIRGHSSHPLTPRNCQVSAQVTLIWILEKLLPTKPNLTHQSRNDPLDRLTELASVDARSQHHCLEH